MVLYDSKGRYAGPRETFRASGNMVAIAGTAPFINIAGVANKVVRVQRIRISGLTLTAVQYLRVAIAKYSTAISGGTPSAATVVSTDSGNTVTPQNINTYAGGAPTPGTLVGSIAEKTILGQATTAVAAGIPAEADFDFDFGTDTEAPCLRGAAENLSVLFPAAPATAVTLSYEIVFTQDGI